ncbi:MAG: hypothetical protein JWN96_1444, partial [Mycobacterium sp.]|nr:hypothetical protein [Mycobacterium sp.]
EPGIRLGPLCLHERTLLPYQGHYESAVELATIGMVVCRLACTSITTTPGDPIADSNSARQSRSQFPKNPKSPPSTATPFSADSSTNTATLPSPEPKQTSGTPQARRQDHFAALTVQEAQWLGWLRGPLQPGNRQQDVHEPAHRRGHLGNVFGKLGVTSRKGAASHVAATWLRLAPNWFSNGLPGVSELRSFATTCANSPIPPGSSAGTVEESEPANVCADPYRQCGG